MNLRKKINYNLINIPGWRTNRKIVVIESDDWGSIRMPSKEVYNALLKKGIRVDNCPYCRYDSLASEEDLSALFDILTSFKDKNGNHPVITANSVVANPDFGKIKDSGFQEYYYEKFTDTLKKYPNHAHSFELWKEGMRSNIFHPQFHGREHLNVLFWMESLKRGDEITIKAFEEEVWGMEFYFDGEPRTNFMAGLDYVRKKDEQFLKQSIIEGMNIFNQSFGYYSKSFIANCYIWDDYIERILKKEGVVYLQGSPFQSYPLFIQKNKNKKGKYHYTGEKNKYNQKYLVRNCFFEPSQYPKIDWVDNCMKRINIAFRWHKPAIISMHRLNVIGSICKENQYRGLKSLKELLNDIKKKWPEVEFMTSVQLGDLMSEK